jgi:hypothetical protein
MIRDDDDDDDERKLCFIIYPGSLLFRKGFASMGIQRTNGTEATPLSQGMSLRAKEQADRFMTDFMETLAHEQPVMTARLMEVIMADSEGNYSLDFPEWLLNFSMLDLHDRTGRENQGNVTHGLLLTQSISYTDNMKKRSLPSSFDSRTHWSNCGEARVSKGEATSIGIHDLSFGCSPQLTN